MESSGSQRTENQGGAPLSVGRPELAEGGEAVEELLGERGELSEPRPTAAFGEYRGRTALVTGGATGIGRAVAVEFARRGTNVAFNWEAMPERDVAEAADRTERELRQLEVDVVTERADVRDSDAVDRFVARVRERLGGPHYLVNAAGVHRSAPIWRMSDDDWRDVLEVNLTGAFHTIRAVAPTFREQRLGKVVNVASIQAFRGSFGVANYAASKGGLVSLTRAAAADLGPSNVNVNAVAPGFVRTEMLRDVPEETVKDNVERSALGRVSRPRDVAGVVLFLCSEMARQITGQVIRVDGGLAG